MHMQMPNTIIGKNMKPKQKILFNVQLPKPTALLLKLAKHISSHAFIDGRLGGFWIGEEFLVLGIHGHFRAGEDLGTAVGRVVPEVDEVGSELFQDEAGFGDGGGVDHVVDSGFGDYEGVSETLAFGTFVSGGGGVLAGVVRGEVADDIGVGGLGENQRGWVVECVFLCQVCQLTWMERIVTFFLAGEELESGVSGIIRDKGWLLTEKKVSVAAQTVPPGEFFPTRPGGMKLFLLPFLEAEGNQH